MRAWVGPRSPGVFENGAGVLNENDHALAVFGTAHWMENFSTGASPRDRRQSTSIKWPRYGAKPEAIDFQRELPLSADSGRLPGLTPGSAGAELFELRWCAARQDRRQSTLFHAKAVDRVSSAQMAWSTRPAPRPRTR
jgi:hypothetical protein